MREFEGETPLVQRIRGLMRERERGRKVEVEMEE